MKKKKKIRKNSSQVSFPEYNFYRLAERGNSYQNVLNLLDSLKKKLKVQYNHLLFEHPSKIFELEKELSAILKDL
jgi:hypothetical protein